jgi:hypothetical protein
MVDVDGRMVVLASRFRNGNPLFNFVLAGTFFKAREFIEGYS